MIHSGFLILDHSADLGIEACGKTLKEAFEQAALALMSTILEIANIQPRESRTVEIKGVDREQLLVKWLTEVLYLYDGKGFVGSRFEVKELTDTRLKAVIYGEKFNSSKHPTKLDVKAITYHQLEVKENSEGAVVRVFLDI